MFGWCGPMGLPSMGSDPDKDRMPPPDPTPLDFPLYRLPDVPETASESSLRGMHGVLASIRRPQDISPQKFKDLNLRVESDLPAAAIVSHDGAASAPPLPWEMDSADLSLGHRPPPPSPEDGKEPSVFMDNGNAYPPKERFEVLRAELLLDNDDAFREVARLPPRAGRQRVRVSQARKFWTGLERMAQYWDTSLDEYFERPKTPEPPTGEGEEKEEGADGMQETGGGNARDTSPMDVDSLPAAAGDGDHDPLNQNEGPQRPESPQETNVKRYRGRRIACGKDMTDDIREETVRALTEMAAWPFGCQVSLPINAPRLAIGSLLFPVRQTFQATRSPKDRALARSGILEGPVFVAQCRSETAFRDPGDAPGFGLGEMCDIVREVGSMLLAAQERAREGTTEVRPGEGKWWTTAPRWGGAPNNAIGDSDKVSSEQEQQEQQQQQQQQQQQPGNGRKRSKYDHPFLSSRRAGSSRKLTNSEKWKIVQPGPSLWDRRLRYQQIGKPKDSPFDDIYMLSSINHHLAILHLRVHRRYIEILTTGSSNFPPDSNIPDQPWHVLQLRRTRWYDLLDAQDRLEVFQGIWRLFHCLLRCM